MSTTRPIAQTTAQAYATINPDEALQSGDSRYVPLDAARGINNIANSLTKRIVAHEEHTPDGYARFLVTGHRGCGKTTELYRLKELIAKENFPVVYYDAETELNLQSLNWWNVLLEMVWQIDEQLRQGPYNLRIPNALLEDATGWLARVVTKKTEKTEVEASLNSEFGIGADLPFFAKVKLAVKSLVKTGSSTVKEIQLEAERRPAQLHNAVKGIISHAHDALQKRGYRNLVIIVDGLEKMPLQPLTAPLTTHNNLFIYNGSHLKEPPCHLIYTIPLALLHSEKVGEVFPARPILMPMIHVRHRDGKEDNNALDLMAKVIERRVSPDLFASGVIKMLALASGGHIRDLLHLVREAAAEAETNITKAHGKRAIAGLTDLYDRTIKQEFIETLDHVRNYDVLPGGPQDGELVNLLLVLEYRNDDSWSALHPCVGDAPRYVRSPREQKEEITT